MGGRDWHRVNSIICVCAKEGGKGERAAEERVVIKMLGFEREQTHHGI